VDCTTFEARTVSGGSKPNENLIPEKVYCIRTETPLCLEDAQRIVARYVEHSNTARLHSAIGYVTPKDKLEGREAVIFAERDRKLEAARERRKEKRVTVHPPSGSGLFRAGKPAITQQERMKAGLLYGRKAGSARPSRHDFGTR
jgi:hypothetical protein